MGRKKKQKTTSANLYLKIGKKKQTKNNFCKAILLPWKPDCKKHGKQIKTISYSRGLLHGAPQRVVAAPFLV